MKILERPNGRREECASLANIGYHMFEVNLEGEVYTYIIPGIEDGCKAERVGNKWKIITCDVLGDPNELVLRTDVLVGCAWCNIYEKLWENSRYADTIRRCKEFFSISNLDKAKTIYQTNNGFSYYVTRFGDVWSTENMIKLKGRIGGRGYYHVNLGSAHNIKVHRLVAHHFVRVPKDLSEESLVVNHLDGNKLNNRWDNLEWTTYKGNTEHAYSTGLMHTTIDDHLLERVWQYLQEGWSDIDISRETGIHDRVVSCIRRGKSPRYKTDKYTWPKHSPRFRVLDRATLFSIYDDFMYTDKSNRELSRQYNVSYQTIYDLRRGNSHSDLAREYITSKGLDGYWQGYRHPK